MFFCDEFCYQFWDLENWKIIRSRDVIFNEKTMYKDKSFVKSTNKKVETRNKEYIKFEENSKTEGQSGDRQNLRNKVS